MVSLIFYPSIVKAKDDAPGKPEEVKKEDAAEIENKHDKKEEIVTFDLLTAIQGMHDTLTESVAISSQEIVKETTSDAQMIGTTMKEAEDNIATVELTKESLNEKSEKKEEIIKINKSYLIFPTITINITSFIMFFFHFII